SCRMTRPISQTYALLPYTTLFGSHGRVDEGGFGMRVTRRVAARAVFDEHALDALAGNVRQLVLVDDGHFGVLLLRRIREDAAERDRKSTRLNSSHVSISYAVFCLK